MRLLRLSLFDFKNYEHAELEFQNRIQCFTGTNGSGKTNLLDAIHYLSLTKSAFNSSDSQNIRQGQPRFVIKGEFALRENPATLVCSYQTGLKKIIRENDHDYARSAEHIGKYPSVLIAPNDIELIWDGSELRRKFFDSLISQMDRPYLEHLISYTNHLKQRNGLLRIFSERGAVDSDLLDSYDQKIIPAGNYIHAKRKEFLAEFSPRFSEHYHFLAGDVAEQVAIRYRSDLENMEFSEGLKKNLQRDITLQRTSIGIHRDDFLFLLNGNELKRWGSQGQQKSFLIGLKLAEYQSLAESKNLKPLLLLDDIFDKLDDLRINKLMLRVADGTFGQLFITDASPGRSKELFAKAGILPEFFLVENGKLQRGSKK